MMSPSAVQPCRKAVGLSPRYIQGRLFFVSLHSASMGRASTLRAQHASRTHSGGSLVFDRSANRMHAARHKNLTSRTAVDVSYPIIGKSLITKDRVVMSAVGFYPGVSHVRGDPAHLALHEVFSRSILVIGYHDLGLAMGIVLVLIHQPH